MKIKFIKMHGIGNDFVIIDCTDRDISMLEKPDTIKNLCMRRFGIGADQILLVLSSKVSDFRMKIFNADGNEVEMCGNGIRCLAGYLNDKYPEKKEFEIETLAGIIKSKIKHKLIEVDMGEPVLEGKKIPVDFEGRVIDKVLSIDGVNFNVTCVSMGNPHCIIFCQNINDVPLKNYGIMLENYNFFPNKTNVEFVEIIDRSNIKMKVWERGSGITLACGTGACASAVASFLNNKTDRKVKVFLDGGELEINWDEDNHVYMTGSACKVFEGEVEVPLRSC